MPPVDTLDWGDIISRVDELRTLTEPVARRIQKMAADIWTTQPIVYAYQPDADLIAVSNERASPKELNLCKAAARRVMGDENVFKYPIDDEELTSGRWVKVAVSPTVRRVGEALNFLPGKFPGGIPNFPSPLAALLTSAAVGGGLGYGAGKLFDAIAPGSWQKKRMPKTLGVAGALSGGSLAVPWIVANLEAGESLLSPSPLDSREGESQGDPAAFSGEKLKKEKSIGERVSKWMGPPSAEKKAFTNSYGLAGWNRPAPTAMDVNIDALGRTLWQTGASPQLAATTMGAMYAARQMPDEDADPSTVTAHQLGQLAMGAGKNYLAGATVGTMLNRLTGMPISGHQAGTANVVRGLIAATLPKLLG